jgi:hypothetical protein
VGLLNPARKSPRCSPRPIPASPVHQGAFASAVRLWPERADLLWAARSSSMSRRRLPVIHEVRSIRTMLMREEPGSVSSLSASRPTMPMAPARSSAHYVIGRGDTDRLAFRGDAIHDPMSRHRRPVGYEFCETGRMTGGQMLDDDQRQIRLSRQRAKEGPQRGDTARRCSDCSDPQFAVVALACP